MKTEVKNKSQSQIKNRNRNKNEQVNNYVYRSIVYVYDYLFYVNPIEMSVNGGEKLVGCLGSDVGHSKIGVKGVYRSVNGDYTDVDGCIDRVDESKTESIENKSTSMPRNSEECLRFHVQSQQDLDAFLKYRTQRLQDVPQSRNICFNLSYHSYKASIHRVNVSFTAMNLMKPALNGSMLTLIESKFKCKSQNAA